MNGTQLAALVAQGYAIAAANIGTPYTWYRAGLINPITPQYQLGILPASFAVDNTFKSTPNYQTILYRAFVDTAQAQPGDILVGQYTMVMLETGPLLPPLALICTDQIKIERPAINTAAGLQSYSKPAPFTLIASGLPANINMKKEVGTLPANLPGDVSRRTYWLASFVAADGSVKDGDIITDGEGYRYSVTAANWQSIYYQCLCERLES
jgi:hypothetical protein